jgi:pilus assembly protein Flp/PilA
MPLPKEIAMMKPRTSLHREFRRFLADIQGATAIEYGLIAVIIATGILASLNLVSGEVVGLFQRIGAIFPN